MSRSSRKTKPTENFNVIGDLTKIKLTKEERAPKRKAEKAKYSKLPIDKSAPISKYRRRTANARERDRMREINDAFDALKASTMLYNLSKHVVLCGAQKVELSLSLG